MKRLALLVPLLLLLTAPPATAQPRAFVGPGFGGFGPGFGYFPGQYRGFYSNGFSLYGPPVVTGGPVPGYFGGSEQRYNGNPNSIFWPNVGVGVVVPIYPRRRAPQPSWEHDPPVFWQPPAVRPLPELNARDLQSDELPPPSPAPTQTPTDDASMTIEVLVPPTAAVRINDQATQAEGATRVFQSPPLRSGGSYTYEVEATWDAAGVPVRQRREVRATPGGRERIDFTKPVLPGN